LNNNKSCTFCTTHLIWMSYKKNLSNPSSNSW